MASTCSLFCMGNPLLDIMVNSEEILKKYDLKANDAILAEDKHLPIYEDVVRNHKVTYVAGGAAQNAARGAAYNLPPNSVYYTGCVGDDVLAEQLKAANKKEGLLEVYQVKKGEKTGACAVIITGHDRSLVTTLRVAEKFEGSHLKSPEVAPHIESAKVFYIEGYFLTHGAQSATDLAKQVTAAGKIFALNFSAPFILQFFGKQVAEILPYCDIVIANESEAESWATANGVANPTDLPTVAKAIATSPKAVSTPRTVILTHGAQSTVWVSSLEPDTPHVHAVHALTSEQIVDTNGAGDAFAGGFLGAWILKKTIDECVEVGHKMGSMCVQEVGAQFKWPKVSLV